MKILIIALSFLCSTQVFAVAQGHFLGLQGMISITHPTGGDANSDHDAKNLFAVMDVPIQNSPMGPGKGIVAGQKVLNLSCADRGASGYLCSIVIQRSSQTVIDSSRKIISYRAQGEEANELIKKFMLERGEIHFKTSDGQFKIDGTKDSFLLEYR